MIDFLALQHTVNITYEISSSLLLKEDILLTAEFQLFNLFDRKTHEAEEKATFRQRSKCAIILEVIFLNV